ncbi:hypothetical protein LVY74_12030 [Acinetobacter sp. ME22]|uniref:hypothetical protein n=1 Tax=Acinetobacter sp. ME22 TaxID=2904802 RepID=UPI001EDBAFCF|nr:hypothetical protein [Acinetobacter sp. ME22]MCG2574278.1 hypothetical protein [Acinetobacter sp. ME22]
MSKLPITLYGYEGFFNSSSLHGNVVKNLANPSKKASIIGNPENLEDTLIVSGGNGINTGIPDSKNFTYFVIIKNIVSEEQQQSKPFIIGTSYGRAIGENSNTYGTALTISSKDSINFQCARGNKTTDQITGSVTIKGIDISKWNLIWVKCLNNVTTVRSETDNIQNSIEFDLPRLLQTDNIKIGTGTSINTGKSQILNTMIFNRALGQNEIEKIVNLLKNEAEKLNIII